MNGIVIDYFIMKESFDQCEWSGFVFVKHLSQLTMKKLLSLIVFSCFLILKAQVPNLAQCEESLKNYRYVNKDQKWKLLNFDKNYGNILYKEVEYFNSSDTSESKKYWLLKLEDNGHFYFGDINNKKEEKKFYANENDALVALFIWQCCKVYLDEGLVSNLE